MKGVTSPHESEGRSPLGSHNSHYDPAAVNHVKSVPHSSGKGNVTPQCREAEVYRSEAHPSSKIKVLIVSDRSCSPFPQLVPSVTALKEVMQSNEVPLTSADATRFTGAADGTGLGGSMECVAEEPIYVGEPSSPAVRVRRGTLTATSMPKDIENGTPQVASADREDGKPFAMETSGITSSPFAWVTVKGASVEELREIMDWLPIHVLTRRKVISILTEGLDDIACDEVKAQQNRATWNDISTSSATAVRHHFVGLDSVSDGGSISQNKYDKSSSAEDAAAAAGSTSHPIGNFLEYFPAHGYAVLCLQAAAAAPGIVTEDGGPQELTDAQKKRLPCVSVIALVFESSLFTFSAGRFGGEGDVSLILANHAILQRPAASSADSGSASGVPISSPTQLASSADGISVLCSSIISAIINYLQRSIGSLLMEADQLDELVLQILPSRVDQDDLLRRTSNIRHLISGFHMDALQKERVLKQLLLPAMRQTPLSHDLHAVERYQRSLSTIRSTVLRLRKGRDTLNLASMTLISGVSARLLTHCHWMDYLNHVQTQIAVIVMPISVIPGVFAMNVKVPWSETESFTPFWCITGITLALFVIGILRPMCKFFTYSTPGALVPLND